MAKKHMKTCSTSPIIREMQIKTMRYYLIPVRIAIINKSTHKMLERMWGQGNRCSLLMVMEISAATMETVWRFLKKLKIELPYDPAILPLGIYLKKPKTQTQKYICTPRFITALFTIAKIWKQPKCSPIYKWIYTMRRK